MFFLILASLPTDHESVPYSPDLKSLDFWLWGAAKQTVFADKPTTLDDFKQDVPQYIHLFSMYRFKL